MDDPCGIDAFDILDIEVQDLGGAAAGDPAQEHHRPIALPTETTRRHLPREKTQILQKQRPSARWRGAKHPENALQRLHNHYAVGHIQLAPAATKEGPQGREVSPDRCGLPARLTKPDQEG